MRMINVYSNILRGRDFMPCFVITSTMQLAKGELSQIVFCMPQGLHDVGTLCLKSATKAGLLPIRAVRQTRPHHVTPVRRLHNSAHLLEPIAELIRSIID